MWFRASEKELQALLDGISNIIRQTLYDSLLNHPNEEHPFVARLKTEIKQEIEKLNLQTPALSSPLTDMIERHVNRNVEINTPAGIIEGIIAEVGSNYVEIHEPGDMIVIVLLANAISVQAN